MHHYLSAKKVSTLSIFIFVFIFLSCEQAPHFPQTGKKAVYQRSLDLRGNVYVLSIAIQPGYEDLSTLAYLRLGKGATILSAYVTNGESGESDIKAECPPYLAAIRRKEASKAISYLGGNIHFLNMPDIAAARDTAKVRELWPSNILQSRLTTLFNQFKPDIILIARDWAAEKSPRWQVLYSDVLTAIKNIAPPKSLKKLLGVDSRQSWRVDRVFIDSSENHGISVPINERYPIWKNTYRTIGQQAADSYRTIAIQRRSWMNGKEPSYHLFHPIAQPAIQTIDAELTRTRTTQFHWIKQEIESLTDQTQKGKTKGTLEHIAVILDSVNYYLAQRHWFTSDEVKTLLHWNGGLEDLRCSILGVDVEYTLSDTALTERQLTFLTIDKVKGLVGAGETEIYFVGLDQGWVINEDLKQRLPLKLHEKYRLLSPDKVEYTYPPGVSSQQSSTIGKPLTFFIIHRAEIKEHSFVYHHSLEFQFAPRFVTEILTPIVRMVPNEKIAIKLTNLSRDGVTDTIKVDDTLAASTASAFRLNQKEATHRDSLLITWKGNPDEGSYLIPLQIGGVEVVKFAARKFKAEIDSSKAIGMITAIKNSPLMNALNRLNVEFSQVKLDNRFTTQIDKLDVLIIDRRVLSLKPEIGNFIEEIDDFVNHGGHLLVLAQDAASWNANPLWQGIRLTSTFSIGENIPLRTESTHTILTSPNLITSDDWGGWLFRRGYNIISGSILERAQKPVTVMGTNAPLLISFKEGKGYRTFTDLALCTQWMNIHPGAFRLLANFISYGEKEGNIK